MHQLPEMKRGRMSTSCRTALGNDANILSGHLFVKQDTHTAGVEIGKSGKVVDFAINDNPEVARLYLRKVRKSIFTVFWVHPPYCAAQIIHLSLHFHEHGHELF